MLEYQSLMMRLRDEAEAVAASDRDWPAADVADKLLEIADELALIRKQHAGGIDASMGKRSGLHLNEP